jgi:hypothetical protein
LFRIVLLLIAQRGQRVEGFFAPPEEAIGVAALEGA